MQITSKPISTLNTNRTASNAAKGGSIEYAIAAAAEVAASVFAKWSHEALTFAQRVRAGEDGAPVHH